MNSTGSWQSVIVHPDRQYTTGAVSKQEGRLPDQDYSKALDILVIGCVDIIPIYQERMLIGLRSWEPQPDWWCFGGRMQKGELYQMAAVRNVKRELFFNTDGVDIDPDRFGFVGVYNLIWGRRAQYPVENGCHMLSITMMLILTDKEVNSLSLNEEYRASRWVDPVQIIEDSDTYHPCLIQMAKDVSKLLSSSIEKTDL